MMMDGVDGVVQKENKKCDILLFHNHNSLMTLHHFFKNERKTDKSSLFKEHLDQDSALVFDSQRNFLDSLA